MAKRFTDTEKWKKLWYQELGPKRRDVRSYVLDNCDFAGVWEINMELISFQTGGPVTREDINEAFRGRAKEIDADKLFIPDFIEFQYGVLKEDSRPHLAVITRLKKLDLWKGYAKGMYTLKDKDKEMDKDKDRGIYKGDFDFDPIYLDYPRKEGKAEGLDRLRKTIKTQDQFDAFAKSVSNYAQHCVLEKKEPSFIRQFSSFVGPVEKPYWPDWVNWKPPKSRLANRIQGEW